MSSHPSAIERMAHDLHRRVMGGILTEAEIEHEWPRRKARFLAGMVEAIETMMECGEEVGDSVISEAAGRLLDEHEKGSSDDDQ